MAQQEETIPITDVTNRTHIHAPGHMLRHFVLDWVLKGYKEMLSWSWLRLGGDNNRRDAAEIASGVLLIWG